MKSAATNGNIQESTSGQEANNARAHHLQEQIEHFRAEKEILLALSNDLTRVRQKEDLIQVFALRLKSFYQFSHAAIAILDKNRRQYHPFLVQTDAHPAKDPTALAAVISQHYPINDPFITRVLSADRQICLELEEIVHQAGIPAFLKLNYSLGVRSALVTQLRDKMEIFGYVFLGSMQSHGFTDELKNTLLGIAPHLSSAVTNVMVNEEMEEKDKDKSFLIDFSHAIASARTKNELSNTIHQSLKQLGQIRAYFIRTINEDGETLSPFMHDRDAHYVNDPPFKKLLATKIPGDKGITGRVLRNPLPVPIDFEEEVAKGNSDHYIEFWKGMGSRKVEFQKMVGVRLIVGEKPLGMLCVISENINIPLLEGISDQLAVAISNIRSNEEIAQREEEKSLLLAVSDEIASLRSREDLLRIVNTRIKDLLAVREFGIAQINEDGTTYSAFVVDVEDAIKRNDAFYQVTNASYSVNDVIFSSVMQSDDPVTFDVRSLTEKAGLPAYVKLWNDAGIRYVSGMAMKAAGRQIGCVFLHLSEGSKKAIRPNLLKAISAQLSVAVANIIANEQIIKKNQEKTHLLDFSNDIARVKTKDDLQAAIFKVLDKTLHTKLAMLRVIEDDGLHLSPFMFDNTLFSNVKSEFDLQMNDRITIHEQYTARVLASHDGVVINIEEEMKSNNAIVRLWKSTGLKNMYGLPLRAGNKNMGTLWLMANGLSELMLKGICAQISIAIANIQANEKLLAYKKQLEVENYYLKEQIATNYDFSEIVGSGPQMQKVFHLMSIVAESASTVLLLGETGTGKELIARAVHNASPRKSRLMVKVNCAAMPANLIESELFGHEKGAFTGAIERRIGKFEMANQSTLFLDEIGEMPLETQVKLLRALQEREIERVGGRNTIKVDVRIIAATNRNLDQEVKAGRFRSDLYYRLNVFPITLPPLRERLEDIPPLAQFFLERYNKSSGRNITSIAPVCIKNLQGYLWPGNVRELEHLIERSVLLTRGTVLEEVQLPALSTNDRISPTDTPGVSLEQIERAHIIDVLRKCGGKIAGADGAAARLEIPSTTLHSKMKKLRISKSDYFSKGG